MIPPAFGNFFIATASAAAALVGLLFVAVSVAPGRTAGPNAPEERRLVAASAFGQLSDAFFISLACLMPGPGVGPFLVVLAILYLVGFVPSAIALAARGRGAGRKLRRGALAAQAVVFYGWQITLGVGLLRQPDDASLVYSICVLLLVLFGLSIIRAWELLGASRFGVLARLSPLNDVDDEIA